MRRRTTLNLRVLVGTAILLVAAAFLFSRVASLTMGYSEAFSVFHVSGTYVQVFDPDLAYPPGFYVILYGWIRLVGSQEIAVCAIAAFTGLIAVALTIQIGRRLHSWRAGWLAAFAAATSGYATYFFLELRATSIAPRTLPIFPIDTCCGSSVPSSFMRPRCNATSVPRFTSSAISASFCCVSW